MALEDLAYLAQPSIFECQRQAAVVIEDPLKLRKAKPQAGDVMPFL